MERLGIELVLKGQDSICIMHCNAQSKPCGDGKVHWLTIVRGYPLKLNPTINNVQKQPLEKMEVFKDALDR